MNILVTGCAGFIGSHLVEELLKSSDNLIFGVDNFYSGSKENLEFIRSKDMKAKFEFIEADIRNFEQINTIIKNKQIKQVYHLAAIVSVQESIKNPLLSNEVNVKGALNVLEAARLNNAQRIVFSSSAAVYGDEPSLPKDEISITKPISPYGCDKLIGEHYMKLYSELYELETVILRYFNVYGERQSSSNDYSGVISIFENKFQNNELPIIYGSGEQYRDFIYVKDVVQANVKAMNTPQISGEVFCVGTSKKTSLNDLVEILNTKYSLTIKPIYADERKGDIKESICNNNKIQKVLNLKNFTSFEKGILKI